MSGCEVGNVVKRAGAKNDVRFEVGVKECLPNATSCPTSAMVERAETHRERTLLSTSLTISSPAGGAT